jgi:GDP-L-fucose synthase
MKVLVTGATGFLGQVLCRELEQRGENVVRVSSRNCDLRQSHSLHQFNGERFDRLFHLAAWTQAGDFCLFHAGEQWIINQQLNTNLLTWWHEQQSQAQLICIGSSCVYDSALTLREENYLTGIPTESLFTYAMTKRMLYAGCLALQKQFDHRFLCVVPSTLYGPDYHTDGRQMHFIFDVIRKITRARFLGETVTLWGDGWQRRELIHVNDFVSALLRLLELGGSDLSLRPNRSLNIADTPETTSSWNLVNIGAGEEFPILHFADLVCQFVGYDPNRIEYDPSRYVGATSKCLQTERLKELIPELRLTRLDDGLRETVDWFLANKERFLA